MKELLDHLMSDGPIFLWYQIYSTWGIVGLIFIIDNVLRVRYNRKLLEEHTQKVKENNHRIISIEFELKQSKKLNQDYELRNGKQGSILDIQDYNTVVRNVSFSQCNDLVELDTDLEFKYGAQAIGNVPELKE